ncbi:hypothetical protein [Novosphingobium humi]|nr:hypothetical protein [Novosphingobium humi]WJS97561.1 hypothetical protein NYQ05_10350 [Novosphingobium humi]
MAGRIASGAGLFAALLGVVALGVMRAAWAIRLPENAGRGPGVISSSAFHGTTSTQASALQRTGQTTVNTRAQHVAQAAMRSLRREDIVIERTREQANTAFAPLGLTGGAGARRQRRISGAARRRDARNGNGGA